MKTKGILIAGGVLLLAVLFALLRPAGYQPEQEEGRPAAQGGGFSFSLAAGARRVDVLKPRRGPIAATIDAPGTIQAGSEVGIGARFEGTVVELVKDVGDAVGEGEVVFRLDPADKQRELAQAEIERTRARGALAEAQAELEEAQRRFDDSRREPSEVTEARLRLKQSELSAQRANAQQESAKTRLDRAKTMQREGIGLEIEVISAQDEFRVATISARIADEELHLARETLAFRVRTWDETKAEVAKTLTISQVRRDNAQADVEARQLALAQAQRDLARCEIRSPITGVVTGRGINNGDMVTRMGEAAHYIVSDLEHLLVYADVDENDVVRVERGQPAKVRVNALGDERQLKAAVYDVGYRAQDSSETKTFRVRILIEPGQEGLPKLRPGMNANVTVTVAQSDEALKVPLQAVVQREVQELPESLQQDPALEGLEPVDLVDVVYTVHEGKAQVRRVELGIQDEDEAEVLGGLQPDEQVVVGPFRALEKLAHDKPVQPTEAKDVLPPEDEADVAAVDSAAE